MKKIFNSKYYFIIWAVLLATYNLLVFLLTNNETRQAAFWISYGFIMFGFITNFISALLDFPDNDKLNPLTTFSFTYVVVAALVSIIYLIIPNAHFISALVPYIVLTAIYIILMVFSMKTMSKPNNQIECTCEVCNMHDLIDFFKELKEASSNLAVRNALNDLSHYIMSASVSDKNNQEVIEIENRIFEYSRFVKKNVEQDELGNIFNNINNVRRLVKEREIKLRK